MVILPYKDCFELFSRYTRRLIVESLGKENDLDGKTVNQGIAVFWNKGSTEQHSYVQQLRECILNFFVTFIEVHHDRQGRSMIVESGVTSGDNLQGFLLGTLKSLHKNGRESITLTITKVSPFSVGLLIALYERAVGLYASLVNINAYHQPGVEAGKKAAAAIRLQQKILKELSDHRGQNFTSAQIAVAIAMPKEIETILKDCELLSAIPDHGITKSDGRTPFEATYQMT